MHRQCGGEVVSAPYDQIALTARMPIETPSIFDFGEFVFFVVVVIQKRISFEIERKKKKKEKNRRKNSNHTKTHRRFNDYKTYSICASGTAWKRLNTKLI